jgi:hypothetical protein
MSPDKVDFIGPGIDVGFRIAAMSTLKRISISVDLAYLLSIAYFIISNIHKLEENRRVPLSLNLTSSEILGKSGLRDMYNSLKMPQNYKISYQKRDGITSKTTSMFNAMRIHFSGSKRLKGVLGEIDYPIFWINSVESDSIEALKEELYLEDGKRYELKWESVYDFCAAFYENRKKFIRRPLILGRPLADKSGNLEWSSTCDEESLEAYMLSHKFAHMPTEEREALAA